MLKPPRQPYGFKNLLAYKKAEELQMECLRVTMQFPKYKTLIALADQMDRSARSAKQNIVEGWKRNSTKEYYDFLGFSIGANTELEEDCNDIWRGAYPDLMGITGVMGERGEIGNMKRGERGGSEEGEMGARGNGQSNSVNSSSNPNFQYPSKCHSTNFINSDASYSQPHSAHLINSKSNHSQPHSTPLDPLIPLDIEKIPFYPLDKKLPPVVQLKLRCKELNYLLSQLQKSLETKMLQEKTLSGGDIARNYLREIDKNKKQEDVFLEQNGFVRLENGQVIAKKQNG